jgi:hypothetical protein
LYPCRVRVEFEPPNVNTVLANDSSKLIGNHQMQRLNFKEE